MTGQSSNHSTRFPFRKCHVLLILLPLLTFGTVTHASEQWVQLLVQYDKNGLTLIEKAPIDGMRKSPRTPGGKSAEQWDLHWMDASGKIIHSTETSIPLERRAPMTEDRPGTCQLLYPDEGVFVLRVEGPGDPEKAASVQFELKDRDQLEKGIKSLPDVFRNESLTLDLQSLHVVPEKAGVIGSTKIRDNGEDANRIVLVFLGDGYIQEDIDSGKYQEDVEHVLAAFNDKEPWSRYLELVNVYRVDTVSNERGADRVDSPEGPMVDTYYNSTFWGNDIERYLDIDTMGFIRAFLAANDAAGPGVWDQMVLLVNTPKHGGSGGALAISSMSPAAPEIVLHELGHTFAGLADEYTTPYPGFPASDREPNVSYIHSGPNLKWLPWVEEGTPLPTPDTLEFDQVVGTFEGARYRTSGIYRPMRNCLMRSFNQPHCPVCREAHISNYFDIVALVDAIEPQPGSTVAIDNETTFTLTPLPAGEWNYTWTLDGHPLPESGPTITLTPDTLTGPESTLQVTITHSSPWVRLEEISESHEWTILNEVPDHEVWMVY